MALMHFIIFFRQLLVNQSVPPRTDSWNWFNTPVEDAVDDNSFLLTFIGLLPNYHYHADPKENTQKRLFTGQLEIYEENPEIKMNNTTKSPIFVKKWHCFYHMAVHQPLWWLVCQDRQHCKWEKQAHAADKIQRQRYNKAHVLTITKQWGHVALCL